jgi:cell division GTPase FtsZ
VFTTTQARESLPSLAKAAAGRKKAAKNLRDNAIEIHPRGVQGKALLVPEVDIEAAERQIAELQETIEDIELIRLIEERTSTGKETGTPLADVIRQFGHADLLDERPSG